MYIMIRCEQCLRDIYSTQEIAKYQKPGEDALTVVHLDCYIAMLFVDAVDDAGNISSADLSVVKPKSFCAWCRTARPSVTMDRTGQSICLSCASRLMSILARWYADNVGALDYITRHTR